MNGSKNEPCSIVSDCGLSKAEVLKIKLERKYEDLNISAYDTYSDSDFELLRIMLPDIPTIVVCAIDKPIGVVEYVEDLCKRLNIPVVSGGLGIKYGNVKISNRVNGNNGEFFAVDHASYYEKRENKYNLNIISASNGSTNGVIACLMSHFVVSYVIGIKQFCNIEDQIWQTLNLDKIFPPADYPLKYPLFAVALGHKDQSDNFDYSGDIMRSL